GRPRQEQTRTRQPPAGELRPVLRRRWSVAVVLRRLPGKSQRRTAVFAGAGAISPVLPRVGRWSDGRPRNDADLRQGKQLRRQLPPAGLLETEIRGLRQTERTPGVGPSPAL